MGIFSILDELHCTHQRIFYYLLYLRSNFFEKNLGSLLLLQIIGKLLLEKHIPFYMRIIKIFMISSDRIIGQVNELIMNIFWVIVLC